MLGGCGRGQRGGAACDSATSSGSLWWGEAEMRLEHLKKEEAGNQLVKIVGVPGRVGMSGAPCILCQ